MSEVADTLKNQINKIILFLEEDGFAPKYFCYGLHKEMPNDCSIMVATSYEFEENKFGLRVRVNNPLLVIDILNDECDLSFVKLLVEAGCDYVLEMESYLKIHNNKFLEEFYIEKEASIIIEDGGYDPIYISDYELSKNSICFSIELNEDLVIFEFLLEANEKNKYLRSVMYSKDINDSKISEKEIEFTRNIIYNE